MPRKWKPFTPGDRPPGAGVQIEEVLMVGRYQSGTSYRVRMGCCGRSAVVDHDYIERRRRKAPSKCSSCKDEAIADNPRRRLDLKFQEPPWWAVPEAVLARARTGWRWQ